MCYATLFVLHKFSFIPQLVMVVHRLSLHVHVDMTSDCMSACGIVRPDSSLISSYFSIYTYVLLSMYIAVHGLVWMKFVWNTNVYSLFAIRV